MDPREWVRVMAAAMPGLPSASRTSRLVQYAPRLGTEFSRGAFSPHTARECGRRFDALPDYDSLASTLRAVMPDDEEPTAAQTDDERWAERWSYYAGRRLAEGGNRAHLCSLIRTYVPPAFLRRVMARHFAQELAALDEHDAEVARDKAAIARHAAGLARRMAPPPPPKSTNAKAPPPEPSRPKPNELTRAQINEAYRLAAAKQQGPGA